MLMNNEFDKTISDNVITSTNKKDDEFVGVIYKDDKLQIITPIGFNLKKPVNGIDIATFRDDLKLLISVIKRYYVIRDKYDANRDMDKIVNSYGYNQNYKNFPIYSYDYLIQDYINNGYYKEKEVIYKESNSGKINWNQTIKKEKSFFDNDEIFFFKFFRRKQNVSDNEIVTLLHKTCVYESFEKWGFIYFDKNFSEKPQIDIKEAIKYVPLLNQKISKTYSDKNKELFMHMLNVIEHNARFSNNIEYKYGVEYFHPVWELLIDNAFGVAEKEKEKYFPKANWKRIDDSTAEQASSSLRPDTIMQFPSDENYDLFVLDSKYYGLYDDGTNRLPATADINKQITYGKVVEIIDNQSEPYNAFMLPSNIEDNFVCDRYATIEELADYNNKKFGKVFAIYCKVKNIMQYSFKKAPKKDVEELSRLIKNSYSKIVEEKVDDLENYTNDEIKDATNIILTEIDKMSKTRLAASIDLKIFEPIYKRLYKLFNNNK